MVIIRIETIWAILCLAMASAAFMEEKPSDLTDNYRLPLDIMPIHYSLTIRPYLLVSDGANHSTFEGDVEIIIQPKNATNKIVLHSKTLEFQKRQYWSSNDNTKINLNLIEHNDNTDISTYEAAAPLSTTQTYILHFVYTGIMEDDMRGFYRSSYLDSQGNTIWLGSTHFQTHFARRAFPCFDEPKFKATFDITLKRHVSMSTYSNSRLKSTTVAGEIATDVYQTTPPMSTYLVAFIVSNFGHRFDGKFGIIARPDLYNQGEYSFTVGQKLLKEFKNYLGMEYYTGGIDKMDMAAIPDLSSGAMENWGLLTYRERLLLFDEDHTTRSAKQAIAAVIAHEQAHMWFGDLVTCDWWSYTWLNEGFATYFQYFGTSWVETYMQIGEQFVTAQVHSAMSLDSTNNTNPMSNEDTNTQAELRRMFNIISYNKGASFIRMVSYIIGESNFQKSLNEYLNEYKNKTTIPENLFNIWKKYWPPQFERYADNFFLDFTTQVGYPVVKIDLAADRKGFNISQQRFLLNENDGSNSSLLYTVPITFTTSMEINFDDTSPKFFIPQTNESGFLDLHIKVSWIIANIQEVGYYRVNYNKKNWYSIQKALNTHDWGGIHYINRAQIADDLLNLAYADHISYNLALSILEYLKTETHYVPWVAAFTGFEALSIRLGADVRYFGIFIRRITKNAFRLLGFEEKYRDTTLDIYCRNLILSWSCKFGYRECQKKAIEYFRTMDRTPVPVNIRSVVYCSAMRIANRSDYEILVNKFKTTNVATDNTLILMAMGCVRRKFLIVKHFQFILSGSVRRQDKSSGLSSLYSSNNENVSPVFDLVCKYHEELAKAMGGYPAVATVILNIASRFTEKKQQDKLIKFNKENGTKFNESMATLIIAEKTVADNLKWSKQHLQVFQGYLMKRSCGTTSKNVFTLFLVIICGIWSIFMQ